jgi:hypothetical protein
MLNYKDIKLIIYLICRTRVLRKVAIMFKADNYGSEYLVESA